MGYDTVSRLFHWVTVLLVLVMIPVGLAMAQEPPQPWQDRLYVLHKGLGPLVLVVVLLRLAWRAFHPAPPLPAVGPAAATPGGVAGSRRALHALIVMRGQRLHLRRRRRLPARGAALARHPAADPEERAALRRRRRASTSPAPSC